jgi:hypothetical protein
VSSIPRLIGDAFPEINKEFYGLLFDELNAAGLCTVNRNVTMSGGGAFEKQTTQLGDRFLSFIEEPKS